jgi:hypothetical protein
MNKVREHVAKRLAQVREQLAVAKKYDDNASIIIYAKLEKELTALSKLLNG